MRVRDDPARPDPNFAELYDRLPPATSPEPWLRWCLEARPPVLYLGIGAGRLATPLAAAGAQLVGVDADPAMLERLRRRLPGLEVHRSRVEELELGPRFDLVIAPSNLLGHPGMLEAAARQMAPGGRLGFELLNPHWLRSGVTPGVRVLRDGGREVDLEVDYRLADGETWTQVAEGLPLHAPGDAEGRLQAAGLRLRWMGGAPGLGLAESPTYFVLASAPRARSPRHPPGADRPAASRAPAARGRPRRPA